MLGALLDVHPQTTETDVMVASDHGYSTISETINTVATIRIRCIIRLL